MAERFIPGRELSVAVFGCGSHARALGSVEIRAAAGLYDYEAKYRRNDTEYLVPAPIDAQVGARLLETAVAVHRLLGCSGATRVDFRWTGASSDPPMVLELNTSPGMTDHSLLPKIAAHTARAWRWRLAEAKTPWNLTTAGGVGKGSPRHSTFSASRISA